jgi:hypothetical protein
MNSVRAAVDRPVVRFKATACAALVVVVLTTIALVLDEPTTGCDKIGHVERWGGGGRSRAAA